MNLLLSTNPTIIAVIVIAIAILLAVIIVVVLKNKTKNITLSKQKLSLSKSSVKLVQSYCSPIEMRFMEYIHKALPKDFIAFPYVPLEKLLIPNGTKVDFNIASSKVVDVVIFLQKTMEPVLAIDWYIQSPLNQSLKKIDEDVTTLLQKSGLPIVQIKLQDEYEINVLKNDLLNAMNDKVFAKIKK